MILLKEFVLRNVVYVENNCFYNYITIFYFVNQNNSLKKIFFIILKNGRLKKYSNNCYKDFRNRF